MEKLVNKKIKDLVRNCFTSIEKKDIEKVLSFFSEDVTLASPHYSLIGIGELRKYFTRLFGDLNDMLFLDEGIGIMVQGEKIVYQHILETTIDGSSVHIPSIFIFNCNKNRFNHVWVMNDWDDLIIKTGVKNIMHMGWNRDYSNL